jgi:hypothetical protein
MTFLLVVTAPPGAGKYTAARILADTFDPSVLVEGDAFFAFLQRGAIEPWPPESGLSTSTAGRVGTTDEVATAAYLLGPDAGSSPEPTCSWVAPYRRLNPWPALLPAPVPAAHSQL